MQSAHHELLADELASDEDGLSLLRAAARAAAEPASSSSSTTAEELGASHAGRQLATLPTGCLKGGGLYFRGSIFFSYPVQGS